MHRISILCRRLALLTSLPWACAVPAQRTPPELVATEQNLEHRLEERVRQGATVCVEKNSVESVELLLDVMAREGRLTRNHFTAGHYRDIVMDYLVRITDPYARRRVAEEVKKNRKQEHARQWAAEALGVYGMIDHADTLQRALGDKFVGVREWAAWSLGRIGGEVETKRLDKLAHTKDDPVRANAIEALARIDQATYGPGYATAVTADESAAVRCALLTTLAEVLPARVEELSIGAMEDQDWRPRMRAVQNLAEVRSKTAVDALIRALNDGRSVIARRAMDGLQTLTGQPIEQASVWPKWWADNRATFEFPESADGKAPVQRESKTVTFAGIPVDSDHVAFVLDKSYLMQKLTQTDEGMMQRDQAAHAELRSVLERMRGKITYNIYLYDAEITQFSKKPIELSAKNEKRALKFAEAEAGGRSKDMWQVLETVCQVPEIDTVYLISSGEADVGLYCHGNRIGRHLEQLNRLYAKTVHAIVYTEREGDRWHVEQVALATGGTFRAVD